MIAAPDHLGTLRGALSDWLYDPRHTAAPYEAQAAHADAIEAALAECEREGMGDVGRDLSRGHGWEDTAACWVWRLPGWDETKSGFDVCGSFKININGEPIEYLGMGRWNLHLSMRMLHLDWWPNDWPKNLGRWTIYRDCNLSLKSPEGLALLDTARPKVTL